MTRYLDPFVAQDPDGLLSEVPRQRLHQRQDLPPERAVDHRLSLATPPTPSRVGERLGQ